MASWRLSPARAPLDLRDPDAGCERPEGATSSALAHPASVLAGRRILVADDDDDLRQAVGEALATMDAQVLLARNGVEAVRKAVDEQPELILLDYRMPRLDGGQVIEALATHGVSARIVLMTAASDACVLAQRLGAMQYLEKPFSLRALMELLTQLVLRPL